VITLNVWNHIAAVYDQPSGTRRIYVNGALIAERTDPPITVTDSIADLAIGGGLVSPTILEGPFAGLIDEVEIYDRALSAAEIQAIFDAGSAGKCKSGCVQPPAGLISWWPGDGNATDIQDGNAGTLQNGATFDAGEVGQAFSFNGNGQYVNIPAQVYSLQAGTVDFWVNWDGNLGPDLSDTFIGTLLGDNNRSPTFFVRESGEIMFELGDVVLQTTGVTLVPNTWYHLAMTYTQTDGSHNFNVYVNGVLTNSDTATGITDFADTITVGAYLVIPDRIEQFTQGRIDELEIFNRALSTAEIQAIYNAGSAGKCKPTQGADLALTKTDSPDPVLVGDHLTYTLTVTNHGPADATDVTLTDTLPSSVVFVSSSPGAPMCNAAAGTVTCDLDTLTNGASTTVTLTVRPTATGMISNTAQVAGNETDPDAAKQHRHGSDDRHPRHLRGLGGHHRRHAGEQCDHWHERTRCHPRFKRQ
jgi:uncharacterized repeat protein (TIGR01451 family)